MGFIVIAPLGLLMVWIIARIFLWLRRGAFGREWWRAFWLLDAAGLALGVWLAFGSRYHVANHGLSGFPIPAVITSREKDEDPWVMHPLPMPLRISALATDIFFGVALCLAPLAVAAFIKENRGKPEFSGAPRDGAP